MASNAMWLGECALGGLDGISNALQPMSKEEFIRLVTADQPDAPAYFTYDAILNTRERVTLDKNLETLRSIDLDEVLLHRLQRPPA